MIFSCDGRWVGASAPGARRASAETRSAGTGAVSECASRELPVRRCDADRFDPRGAERLAGKIRLGHRSQVGSATISEGANAAVTLYRAAEPVFVRGDALEPCGCDGPQAGPLIRSAEDAGKAREARPAKAVGRCGHDPVPSHYRPNIPF